MTPMQTTSIPEVFVLWHPKCVLGEPLARRILDWLRPGNGLGPEVFYRCLPAPEAPPNGLPLPLSGEVRQVTRGRETVPFKVSNQQIVLTLIDEQMVADPTWRHWLTRLTPPPKSPSTRVMMPVALDPTAYNMPGLRELNYLRPAGVPLADDVNLESSAFEAVVRSLLKQVTEAMCRLLLPRLPAASGASGDPLPKVNIFLSHAKQDGTKPARRLRDYIYGQTQLAAFFDENDIAFSSVFRSVIQDGLSSPDTAALIAVRSTTYASRPWCRREISLFRTPQRETPPDTIPERWRLYPTLVVEAMEGRERSYGIPELGNCPIIRWTQSDDTLEELIVTTVIRDAMLASYHSAVGASIPPKPGQIVINWLPDPTTLLHIPTLKSQTPCRVLYPGRGLSGLELDVLYEFFPEVEFRSFEEELL